MRRGLTILGATVLIVAGCGRTVTDRPPAPDSMTTSTSSAPATTVPTTTTTATTATATTGTADYSFPYQPMWPFAERGEADRWLNEGRASGDSPWHADPRATALKFTREFLEFTDLDRTVAVDERPREAWVGVGQEGPMGESLTVARLHLARLGPAADAPWEVVGSEDTDLTLERPAYGSKAQPTTEVGGTISGVDESLHIQARQSSRLVGEFCCVPAGGQQAPWSATVPITPVGPGVVTVVVSTGGHYALIERFAITALRAD